MAFDIPNYSLDVQSPFQAAMAGYQGVAAIRQDQQAQLQQQQQLAAQQQQQQLLSQLANNPNSTADDYSRAVLLMPGVKDQLKQSWDVKNAAQQQTTKSDASQWGAAIANGQPALAAELMNLRADSMEQASGGAATPESKALRAKAGVVKTHPEFGLGIIQALLASGPDGEKTANALQALGAEGRARQQAAADLTKKEADASKATSEAVVAAGTVPAALEKPKLDNAETREKIESAQTQRRIADLNAQIAQANSETDRGRLVLERDKLTADQALKAQTKATAAQDQYDTVTRSLDTVNSIASHPGLSAVGMDGAMRPGFGGVGTQTGKLAGLIPGTDRKDLEGLVDTLKSQQFLTGVKQLSGMGSLSNAEGEKIGAAVASLNLDQSPQAFKNALGVVRSTLERARNRVVGTGELSTAGGAFVMDTPKYGKVNDGDVNRLLQKYPGRTREQVLQFLQSAGAK